MDASVLENAAQLSDSDDSEFEDALEELVLASTDNIEVETEYSEYLKESRTQLTEREVAKCIVDNVIDSAKKITLCCSDNGAVLDNTSPLQDDSTQVTSEKGETRENSDEINSFSGNKALNACKNKDSDDEVDKSEEDEEDENENSVHQQDSNEASEEENDTVDEELLMERESKLTDDEKQDLRNQAQTLKTEGNNLFKEDNFVGAVVSYTEALRTCPLCFAKERSIMYSNRAACKLHLDQKESAIEDCTKALEINSNYMKCLLRRAELYEKTDKLDEALADYQKALEMDPGLHQAREACMRLPDQIKERNEKLKEEMMGKLKDLGNLVLRPFGLSTNNFKLNQDPNTGGYSVSFQQNPNSS